MTNSITVQQPMKQFLSWWLWRRWQIYCPSNYPPVDNSRTNWVSPCSTDHFGIYEFKRTGEFTTIIPFDPMTVKDD